MIDLCLECIAKAGLGSDRCSRCEDFSGFERGDYSTAGLEKLSARGKLAFLLSELAALKEQKEDDTPDSASR